MRKVIKKASEYKLNSEAQVASAVLMIKPTDFKPNIDDLDQQEIQELLKEVDQEEIQDKAIKEYERFLRQLRQNGVVVVNFDKSNYPQLADVILPDAIYPDNLLTWNDGTINVFPMLSKQREQERVLIPYLLNMVNDSGFLIAKVNEIEKNGLGGSLEAKGSLILDRQLKRVYATLSRRTSEELVMQWAKQIDYEPIIFKSYYPNGKEVQHTDQVLNIGEKFVIVCDEIIDEKYRKSVIKKLSENREVIQVTTLQALKAFVCNSAEIRAECSADKNHVLIMSKKGVESLTDKQISKLKKYANILPVVIPTIETFGGGSARCMIAELFNPYKPYF